MACIDDDALVALAAGALAPELRDRVVGHIADCEWCRALVAELTRNAASASGSSAEPDDLPRELTSGTRLCDRYRLVAVLGVGAHGVVWSAADESTGVEVAVKVLRLEDADIARRFAREARGLANLEHPNVVRVLEGIDTPWGPALVMERLLGRSLAERFAEGGVAPDELAGIGAQIARALAAAHAAGVVHRDLKPANVFVTTAGVVKVLDFGLASFAATGLFTTLLTKDGSLVGTPAYMAPELLLGTEPAGTASDIWSLGALLTEGMTGAPPFGRGPLGRILRAVTTATTKNASVSTAGAGARSALARSVERLLSHQPHDRPSAAIAGQMLEAAVPGVDMPPTFATSLSAQRQHGESS